MAIATTGRLPVPGASLHYEVRGTGPMLLISQSGEGDADRSAALAAASTRIVPAAGRTTPRTDFDHRCAVALADMVGTDLREFPGGHNGNTTHPRAYAAQLRQILQNA